MNIFYLVSIFLHITCAAFWIGGMLFLPIVLMPAIKKHTDKIDLLYKTGLKFRFYGWFSLGILFVTGWMNFYFRGLPFSWDFFTGSSYGRLLGVKLILFAVVLLIAGIHDFYIGKKAISEMQNSDKAFFRNIASWSGRINLLLSLIIAFIGVALSRGGF